MNDDIISLSNGDFKVILFSESSSKLQSYVGRYVRYQNNVYYCCKEYIDRTFHVDGKEMCLLYDVEDFIKGNSSMAQSFPKSKEYVTLITDIGFIFDLDSIKGMYNDLEIKMSKCIDQFLKVI